MKKALRLIAFLCIFILLFNNVNNILLRKELYGWWNITTKTNSFFNSEDDYYDVLFFGSSHAYSSFNPIVVYEQTNLKSHVCATQKQPLFATYFYIKEAIKRQKPSLVVLDCYGATFKNEYPDEATAYTYTDDFPFGINKLKMIRESADGWKNKFNLLVPFTKYHTRWSELTRDDFSYNPSTLHDWLYGYCMLTATDKNVTKPVFGKTTGTLELTQKNEKWLINIINLLKENDIKLLIVKTPDNESYEEKLIYNKVLEIARKNNVPFIDFNEDYKSIGIDTKKDFFDSSHLNHHGAHKFSNYFAKTILKDLTPKSSIPDDNYLKSINIYNYKLTNPGSPFYNKPYFAIFT